MVRSPGQKQELQLRKRVFGDTQHDITGCRQRRQAIAKVARLRRATGGGGGGVEVEDDLLAGEVGEGYLAAILIGQSESGGHLANFESRCHDLRVSGAVAQWHSETQRGPRALPQKTAEENRRRKPPKILPAGRHC